MKTAASFERLHSESRGDFASRVRNFLSTSPLKKRRAFSSSLPALNTNPSSSLVFGVPIDDSKGDIPHLVRKVVEHIESEGLDAEGIYRVSGNSRTITALKTSFDKVGDADFRNQDIAAVAGLLKLFLRELPEPLIPEDMIAEFVELQQSRPGPATPETLAAMKASIEKLPSANHTVLKYLMRHLAKVAAHAAENKMTSVSLSIVFGPNVFRCGGGLEGLRQQGYTNTLVCRMIQHFGEIFQESTLSPRLRKHGEGKARPARPRPYSDYIREKRPNEGNPTSPLATVTFSIAEQKQGLPEEDGEEGDGMDASCSERSIDEAIERSSDTLSPTSPTHVPTEEPTTSHPLPGPLLVKPYNEFGEGDVEDGGQFQRHKGVRAKRRKPKNSPKAGSPVRVARELEEIDGGTANSSNSSTSPATSSLLRPQQASGSSSREEDSIRTPSPYSWQSSPGTSPPTSPALTPRSSRIINAVIEESVQKFLFQPNSPTTGRKVAETSAGGQQTEPLAHGISGKSAKTDVYGLLLPDRLDSPQSKKKLVKQDRLDGTTHTHGNTGSTNTGGGEGEREEGGGGTEVQMVRRRRDGGRGKKLRNRRSALYGEDTELGDSGKVRGQECLEDMNIQILSVSPGHREDMAEGGGGGEGVLSQSGKFAELVRQFDEVDGGGSEGVRGEGGEGGGSPPRRKKPGLKAFEMFEKSGIVMGMARPKVAMTTSDSTHHQLVEGGSSDETVSTPLPRSTTDDNVFATPHCISKTESQTTAGGPSLHQQTLSSTTSDFISPQHSEPSEPQGTKGGGKTAVSDLDAVFSSGTLEHITLTRPKGPAGRRPRKTHSILSEEGGREGREGAGTKEKRRKTTPDGSHTPKPSPPDEPGLPEETPPRKNKTSASRSPNMAASLSTAHTESSTTDSRVPPLDLASLAPEDQEKVSEGWREGVVEGRPEGVEETDSPSLSAKELSHKIHNLKGIVREFEAGFVTEHGHKPSGTEKAPIRPQLEELSQLRKQLKDLKDKTTEEQLSGGSDRLAKITQGAADTSKSPPSFLSPSPSEGGAGGNPLKTMLDRLMASLRATREREDRPDDFSLMSPEQILAEKQSIQKTLLYFEKRHGRPQTREAKETMRPLYDRYRTVKKLAANRELRKQGKTGPMTMTSPEGLEVTNDSLPSVTLLQSSALTQSMPVSSTREPAPTKKLSTSALEGSRQTSDTVLPVGLKTDLVDEGRGGGIDGEMETDASPTVRQLMSDKELSEATLAELQQQQTLALTVKKSLRQVLKRYENEFTASHGRAVQREDRRPMQRQYGEYKTTKGKLKLIETLLTKRYPLKNLN